MKQRLAGQSFPSGVLIKSKHNWALATADGDLRFGSSSSWLDHHRRFDVFFVRSVVSLFESVAFSYKTQRDLNNDSGREFMRPLFIYLAIIVPVSLLIDRPGSHPSWRVHVGLQVLSFIIAFTVFSKSMPRAIWAYHGAEHKAVHAHEQGVDLSNLDEVAACSRVHDRCGTNLVTFFAVASLLRIPTGAPLAATAGTIGYTLLSVGLSIELFRLVVRAPHLKISRLALAPGRWLQRHITTHEPDRNQLNRAVAAVKAVLAMDDMKNEVAGEARTVDRDPAKSA